MKRLTSLLAALTLALPVLAQDATSPDTEEPREIKRYTVEVIIFAYANDVGTGTEIFVPDVAADDFLSVDDAANVQPLTTTGKRRTDHLELAIMDRAEFSLRDVYERMQRLDVYQPLMHFGWTQAAWQEEETPPLELRRFGRPPTGLDGKLTLYLNRYLHLVVDLEMEGENQTRGAGLYGAITGPVYYRIDEDRILRNGEIRYFDHPKFGLLAKVTRVEPDEMSTESIS